MRPAPTLLLAGVLWLGAPQLLRAQQPTAQMDHMHMDDSAMAMPVPMPAGMKMMPGLVGLVPPGETFHIPAEVLELYRTAGVRGARVREAWQVRWKYDGPTA